MDSSSSTSTGTGSDFVKNDNRTKKGAMKIGTGTKKGRKLSVQFATNKPSSPAQNLVLQAEMNGQPDKINDIEMPLSSEDSTIFIHVPEGNSIDEDASLVVEPRKSKRRSAKATVEASPPKPQSSRAAILPDTSDGSIIVPKRRGRRKVVAPEFSPEGTEALQRLLEGNRRNKKKQKDDKDGRSVNQNEPSVPVEQGAVLPDNSDGSIIVPKRKGRRKVVAPEFPPEGIEALKKLSEEKRRKKMNQENKEDGCSTEGNEPAVPLEREASPNQPHMEAEEIRNSSDMGQPQNRLLVSLTQPENTDTAVTIPPLPVPPEHSSISVYPLHETHPSKKLPKIPVATKKSSETTASQEKTPVKTKRPRRSLPYTKKRKNSKSPNKPTPKNPNVEIAAPSADGTFVGPASVIEDDDGTRDDAPAVSLTDDDGSSISQEYVSIVEDQQGSKLLSTPGITKNVSGLSHNGRNVEHLNEEGEGTLPMDADVGVEDDSVFTDIEDSDDGENEPDLGRTNEEEIEEDRTENAANTVSNKSLFGAAQRARSAVTANQVIDTPGPSRLPRNVAIGKPDVSIQNVFNRLTPKKRQQRGRRLRKTRSKNTNDFVYSRAFIIKLAKYFTQTAISKESIDVLHSTSNRIFNNLMEDVQSFMDEKGGSAFQDWTHVYEFLRRQDIVADYQQYCGLVHRHLDYRKSRILIPSVIDGVTVPKYDPKIIENIDVTLNETRGRKVQTSLDESEDD